MSSSASISPGRFATIFNNIKQNKLFEMVVIGVILFSALVIGAKTYDIPASALTV
ncbi:hypothetical protein LCGC14_1999720, partial [marine sediment metagenome]